MCSSCLILTQRTCDLEQVLLGMEAAAGEPTPHAQVVCHRDGRDDRRGRVRWDPARGGAAGELGVRRAVAVRAWANGGLLLLVVNLVTLTCPRPVLQSPRPRLECEQGDRRHHGVLASWEREHAVAVGNALRA